LIPWWGLRRRWAFTVTRVISTTSTMATRKPRAHLKSSFSVAAFYLISASVVGILGSAASFAVAVALTGFEVLIQALQAYIFTLLAAVYIGSALHAEH
jgi:hypothetical protein